MLEKGKITGIQLMFLLFMTVFPTALLFAPGLTVEKAGRDAYMVLFFTSTIFGLVVIWVSKTLAQRFPDRNVFDFSADIVGKFIAKLIGLLYIFFLIQINALIVREFGAFVNAAFMPETPMIVFNIVVVALAASASRNGLEVIARMNQFIFFLVVLSFLLIVSLLLPEMDFQKLFPVLENGVKPVLRGSFVPSGWRGETFLLLLFYPYLNRKKEAGWAGAGAVLLLGLILGMDLVATITVMGDQIPHHETFPTFSLIRYVSLANFVERIEAFVMGLWVAGQTVKVSVWYYATLLTIGHVFNLKDYKPLALPVGVLLVVLSMTLYENALELTEYLTKSFPIYAYIFELGIPFFLLIAASLRGKGAKGK